MESHRFGCFSLIGVITALLTLMIVVGVGLVRRGILFSPGKISAQSSGRSWGGVQSHADLGGDCAVCHVPPWAAETMADRCVACHRDIKEQLQEAQSMHGELFTDACRDCHPDHRGADFSLTLLDVGHFPHDVVGFSLKAHQKMASGEPFTCSDCHGKDITKFDANACELCHQEIDAVFTQAHSKNFSPQCLACHDGVDIYGGDFNHNALAFPLEGEHTALPCSECHGGASSTVELQSAPQACYACHQEDDDHDGKFGDNCAVCHAPSDWDEVTFEHALSGFLLEGQHANVKCEDCHKNDFYQGTSQACVDCHLADDEHNGEFGADCGQCHTPNNWEEANFDHALADFPLTGAHIDVACQDCHIDQVYQGTAQECAVCHKEPVYHAGIFNSDCASCHTTKAWTPAEYNEPHTFPMNHESSGRNSCQTCHLDNLQTYTCYECHEHSANNVAREHREEGISDFQSCMECHPDGRENEDHERGDD